MRTQLLTDSERREIMGRYPLIFRYTGIPGFESFGRGWRDIVVRMLDDIYPLMLQETDRCLECGKQPDDHPVVNQTPPFRFGDRMQGPQVGEVVCQAYEGCKPQVRQIKEKLGSLRIYIDTCVNPAVGEAIVRAEVASLSTCEDCGSDDADIKLIAGWKSTLCTRCEFVQRSDREGYTLEVP